MSCLDCEVTYATTIARYCDVEQDLHPCSQQRDNERDRERERESERERGAYASWGNGNRKLFGKSK